MKHNTEEISASPSLYVQDFQEDYPSRIAEPSDYRGIAQVVLGIVVFGLILLSSLAG